MSVYNAKGGELCPICHRVFCYTLREAQEHVRDCHPEVWKRVPKEKKIIPDEEEEWKSRG